MGKIKRRKEKTMKPRLLLSTKLKMQHRLLLSQHMKAALHALTLPVLELKDWALKEIEKNPLIEIKDKEEFNSFEEGSDSGSSYTYVDEKPKTSNNLHQKHIPFKSEEITQPIIDRLENKESLFDYLLFQATVLFTSKEDIKIAKYIIGNLNSKGFLDLSTKEIAEDLNLNIEKVEKTLKLIQKLDPPGIGCRNLQESLLVQLEAQKKDASVAYKLVKFHFQELLYKKFGLISKKMGVGLESILKIINEDLKGLTLNPAQNFSDEISEPIVPDLTINFDQNKWSISINDQDIPKITIPKKYNDILNNLDRSERQTVQKYLLQGRWLVKAINSRRSTLIKIVSYIVKKQRSFLLGLGPLLAMNYKELSSKLNLHISTISRAISNKYASTPIGIISLRSLFSGASKSKSNKDESTDTPLKILKKLISEEDKKNPLSDEDLAKMIDRQGFTLARRTVAKYRKNLKIASANQRKQF